MPSNLASYLHFFWAGLVKQGQTGAVLPSQRFLIQKMIAPIPAGYRGQILELGAGNGAITLRLARKCPQARILACEINPILAQDTRKHLAAAGHNGRIQVVPASAESLLSEIGPPGRQKVEFIISGIPLGNLEGKRVFSLVTRIHEALSEGGLYVQFQHSLLDRRKIRACFSDVQTIPVLLNLPPAFIYYARK